MSRVFMASDPHLGHRNIAKYRPQVASVEDNSKQFRENVLDIMGKRDILWLMGDIVFDPAHAYVLRDISKHILQINVVLGNHCTENTVRRELIKQLWLEGVFAQVHGLVSYKGVWLSHAPIHPEELRGKFNIHGHTHSYHIDDPRYYNVCVDQTNMQPVLFEDIKKKLSEVVLGLPNTIQVGDYLNEF